MSFESPDPGAGGVSAIFEYGSGNPALLQKRPIREVVDEQHPPAAPQAIEVAASRVCL